MNTSARTRSFVFFLNAEWEHEHRRPHIEALSAYGKAVCVEPPLHLLTPVLSPRSLARWLRGVKPSSPGIRFTRPFMLLPYAVAYRYKPAEYLNSLVLKCTFRFLNRGLNDRGNAAFITCPQQSCAVRVMDRAALVYDCYDAYAKLPWISRKTGALLDRAEKKILQKSAVVFATAKVLYREKSAVHPRTFYFPNAAQVERFAHVSGDIPDDMARIPSPRIGLIGHINGLVDIGLLDYLAEKHKEWSIVLIGALNGDRAFARDRAVGRLCGRSNVYLLGRKRYEDLPRYLKGLDVCMLPYRINSYTDAVHPNKIYQYLAQKKPIVATCMKEAESLPGAIAVARSYGEFERHVRRALREPVSRERGERLLAIARANSVEVAARKKAGILEDCLAGRKRNILFIHSGMPSFARVDYDILSKAHEVRSFDFPSPRAGIAKVMRCLPALWADIRWADTTFSWFGKLHAFFAVLFSKILAKKSIVILSGGEVCRFSLGNGSYQSICSHPVKSLFPKFVARTADLLLPVSQYALREAARNVYAPLRKMKVVYHGFDTARFMPDAGMPKNRSVITVGEVINENRERKRFTEFVVSARFLPAERFVVIGPFGDGSITALRRDAPANVLFTGGVYGAALMAYLRQASVYVQASVWESFACSLAEAMACACVPVVSRIPALEEVVGDCGIYLDDPVTPEEIARKVKIALERPALGTMARARIVSKFGLVLRRDALLSAVQKVG